MSYKKRLEKEMMTNYIKVSRMGFFSSSKSIDLDDLYKQIDELSRGMVTAQVFIGGEVGRTPEDRDEVIARITIQGYIPYSDIKDNDNILIDPNAPDEIKEKVHKIMIKKKEEWKKIAEEKENIYENKTLDLSDVFVEDQ